MKKSKDELVKEFAEKIKKGEMDLEGVKKALTSETPDENKPIQTPSAEVTPAVETKAEEAPKTETPKAEPKLAGNLFKPFSLGATLAQTPNGNIVNNIKPSNHQERSKTQDTPRNAKQANIETVKKDK
jgi:hypothetical protein